MNNMRNKSNKRDYGSSQDNQNENIASKGGQVKSDDFNSNDFSTDQSNNRNGSERSDRTSMQDE